MLEVLRTVHRIRKVEERRAHVLVAEAQVDLDSRAAALSDVEESIGASWQHGWSGNVVDLQAHHAGALRMELRRRATERDVQRTRQTLGDAREALRAAATEARILELVVETRETAAHDHHKRLDGATMDEQGLQSWWRRTA